MIQRLFNKCLLCPGDLNPSRDDFEVIGVFNPGAISVGDEIVLLVRVAETPRERRAGFKGLPRWDMESGLIVDWVAEDELEEVDPRVVMRKSDGVTRLAFISHLRVFCSKDGRSISSETGVRFVPQMEYEEFGVEDPRITRIGDVCYFTYVTVSRHGVATALASTTDFRTFKRHGVIFCPENKDVVLFPEKIGGEYAAIHRPNPAAHFNPPEMWLAHSSDLIHWGRHEHFFGGVSTWEAGRIGAGTPPVGTSEGWLEIYHGSRRNPGMGGVGIYSAGALLLDREDPLRIIRYSTEEVLAPESNFERAGFLPNVVFPTGVVERDRKLLIYYGAADTVTAVVEFSLEELLGALHSF